LAQSGHSILMIVAAQNDRAGPFRLTQITAVIASFSALIGAVIDVAQDIIMLAAKQR